VPDLIRVPDLSHDEQNALDELVVQWRAKRRRNNLRSAFYDMKNSERALMSRAVPNVVRRRKFVLGWSAIAVDKLNRRCNLDGFYDAGGIDLADLGLDDIVRDNRLFSEVSQGGVSSLIHAVSWLVTTQGDTQSGEPAVLMNARDAATATGMWDVRRRAIRSFLSITGLNDDGEPTSMVLYLPNLNIVMSKGDGGRWSADHRPHVYGVPVDPLRYKPRIGRSFGSSRISRAVMSIHTQALAAMIRADVNGEAYSMPRYVLLGATEDAFRNADGSPKSTWQAAWDAVWAIGDDEEAANPRADVKQFSGQSPEPQNAHLRMLAQMFSGETGIPIGELGIIGDSNPTSAEALQSSRDDLIATAEQATDDWSPDIASAATRALRMLTRDNLPAKLDIRPRWRNPMHISRAAAADAGTKVITQAPWLADTEVGLELMGLSRDQIDRALNEKRRAAGSGILQTLQAAAQQQAAKMPTPQAPGNAGA
jgi:hypothetical protein